MVYLHSNNLSRKDLAGACPFFKIFCKLIIFLPCWDLYLCFRKEAYKILKYKLILYLGVVEHI